MTKPHQEQALQSLLSFGWLPASGLGYDSPAGGGREARRDRRRGLVLIDLLSARRFLGIADNHLITFGSASLEFRDRVPNKQHLSIPSPSMSLGLESLSSSPGPAAGL